MEKFFHVISSIYSSLLFHLLQGLVDGRDIFRYFTA